MTTTPLHDGLPILASQTTEALAFVLGMLAARPLRAEEAGRFAALCAELKARGVWSAMVDGLDPDIQAALKMLEAADMGQHLKARGQRRLV